MNKLTATTFAATPSRSLFAASSPHALLRGPMVAHSPDEPAAAAPAPEPAPAPAAAPEPAPLPAQLSIEEATQALMGAPKYEVLDDDGDEPAAAPAEPAAADDQAAAAGADDAGAVEPEAGAEEGEQAPEPVAAAEAPAYWSRDAKAEFAKLSPELQAVVLAQEGPREQAAAKAKADAQAAITAAEEQGRGVQTLAQQLESFLPEAIQTFQQRWGEPDWEATIRQYGAQEAALLRARYDREQAQLGELQQRTTQARAEAQRAYVAQEWQTLATLDKELAPDVSDPTKGADLRKEVTSYLMAQGIGRDAVAQISAVEMALSRKAMLWDRSQAAAKAAASTKPAAPAPAARPAAKPAARGGAAAPGTPAQRTAASVQNSFNAKPSVDNAVALLMARSAGR